MINFKRNQVKFELIGNIRPLNIYPSEVEDVLYKHSAVEECSVVGMPHPEYGEAVSAYVVKKQDRICAEDDLILFCKERIASFPAAFFVLLPASTGTGIIPSNFLFGYYRFCRIQQNFQIGNILRLIRF